MFLGKKEKRFYFKKKMIIFKEFLYNFMCLNKSNCLISGFQLYFQVFILNVTYIYLPLLSVTISYVRLFFIVHVHSDTFFSM